MLPDQESTPPRQINASLDVTSIDVPAAATGTNLATPLLSIERRTSDASLASLLSNVKTSVNRTERALDRLLDDSDRGSLPLLLYRPAT